MNNPKVNFKTCLIAVAGVLQRPCRWPLAGPAWGVFSACASPRVPALNPRELRDTHKEDETAARSRSLGH